jgi:hypothetical protein
VLPKQTIVALALLAWYLIMPPSTNPGACVVKVFNCGGGINVKASMSRWSVEGTFDMEKDCKRALHAKQVQAIGRVLQEKGQYGDDLIFAAECIASDDPRLKP